MYRLYAALLVLCSCTPSQKQPQMNQDKIITITGTALNAKAGAVVRTEKGNYYIHDLSSWPDSIYEKTVEVTGELSVIDHSQQSGKNAEGKWVQSMRGIQQIIQHAQWKVVPAAQ